MSTTKNEHNPEGLTAEQICDGWRLLQYGEVIEPTDEMWHISYGKGRWVPTGSQAPGRPIEKCNLAHRRRITPPTDTTGSGREGEPYKNDPVKRADYWKERYEILHGEVEALRRDGELLDTLESLHRHIVRIERDDVYWTIVLSGGRLHFGKTLRAAIDSAQRQEKP